MKHLKRIAKLEAHYNAFSGSKMSVTHLVLMAGLTFSSLLLKAQCTSLICNGASQSAPLEVAIDGMCEVTIVPDAILESEQSCSGTKLLTVRDDRSQLIMEGKESVTVGYGDT